MTTTTLTPRILSPQAIAGAPDRPTAIALPPSEEVIESMPAPQMVDAEPQQATPPGFVVGTLLDDRLRLSTPLQVEIERENEWYVAECEALDEFGFGADPMSAVDDLRQTLAELYWTLKEEQHRLAPGIAETWLRLRGVIQER